MNKQEQQNIENIYNKSIYMLDDDKAIRKIAFIGSSERKVSFELIFQQARQYSAHGYNVLLVDFMGIANRIKKLRATHNNSFELVEENTNRGNLKIISDKNVSFKNKKIFDIHYSYLEADFDIILYQLPPAESYDKKINYALNRVDFTIIEVVKNVTFEEELIMMHEIVKSNTDKPISAVLRKNKRKS